MYSTKKKSFHNYLVAKAKKNYLIGYGVWEGATKPEETLVKRSELGQRWTSTDPGA